MTNDHPTTRIPILNLQCPLQDLSGPQMLQSSNRSIPHHLKNPPLRLRLNPIQHKSPPPLPPPPPPPPPPRHSPLPRNPLPVRRPPQPINPPQIPPPLKHPKPSPLKLQIRNFI